MSEPPNVTISYDIFAKDLVKRLLGKVDDIGLARLVAAIDGSLIDIQSRGEILFIQVFHPFIRKQEMFIQKDSDNELFIYIDWWEFKKGHQNQGISRELFVQQVAQAQKQNVHYLALFAEGNYGSKMNGYYVWARFGFDSALTDAEIKELPKFLQSARTVNDIMKLGGAAYWKQKGKPKEMFFRLSENSSQMEVLKNYVKSKIK